MRTYAGIIGLQAELVCLMVITRSFDGRSRASRQSRTFALSYMISLMVAPFCSSSLPCYAPITPSLSLPVCSANIVSGASLIIQKEGIGSLFTGLGSTLFGYLVQGSLKYGCYEVIPIGSITDLHIYHLVCVCAPARLKLIYLFWSS